MAAVDGIKKTELEFPGMFSSVRNEEFGLLFFNEENKASFDSNHAVLFPGRNVGLSRSLFEIADFYLQRGITPRIYQSFADGWFMRNRSVFDSCGYEVNVYGTNKFMVLREANRIVTAGSLGIRRLRTWDERIEREIFVPSGEEHEISVFKRLAERKNVYMFAGYEGDRAVTITNLHVSEHGCTRFNYILTARDRRNNGYARELLRYVVEFCKENDLPGCYQWPAHATSEKLCYEAGFRVLFEAEGADAVYRA